MIRLLCIFITVTTAALSGCGPTRLTPDGGPASALDASTGASPGVDQDGGTLVENDAGVDGGESDGGVKEPGANGVWLTRNYVAYSSFYDATVVDDLADRMTHIYEVGHWFMNVDRTGSDGRLINPAPRMNEFLNNVASWEARRGARLKVFAWVSGATTGETAMDLTNPVVRRTVVEECQKLVAPSVTGSYVALTARPFDGVQIDFEPSGFDEVRFNALLTLMEELRVGLAEVGRADVLLSFAAHKFGTSNTYQWSQEFYYQMARRVDLVASMTYNSGSTTGADYQVWMRQQLATVLRGVSGAAWSDGSHPAPENGVKVLFGLPAYPPNANHDPAAENIAFGADGLREGMAALAANGDPSLDYLGGAAVYLHTKGLTNDGYARWDTEWWWFGHHWLQRW